MIKINDIYKLKKDVEELRNTVPEIPDIDLSDYYNKTEIDNSQKLQNDLLENHGNRLTQLEILNEPEIPGSKVLYFEGNECISQTDGWSFVNTQHALNLSIKNEKSLVISSNKTDGSAPAISQYAGVCTSKKINFIGYNKLFVECTLQAGWMGNDMGLTVGISSANDSSMVKQHNRDSGYDTDKLTIFEFDISDWSGENYLKVMMGCAYNVSRVCTSTITKIWIEKDPPPVDPLIKINETLNDHDKRITDNTNSINSVESELSNKANSEHTHNLNDVIGEHDFITKTELFGKEGSIVVNRPFNFDTTTDYGLTKTLQSDGSILVTTNAIAGITDSTLPSTSESNNSVEWTLKFIRRDGSFYFSTSSYNSTRGWMGFFGSSLSSFEDPDGNIINLSKSTPIGEVFKLKIEFVAFDESYQLLRIYIDGEMVGERKGNYRAKSMRPTLSVHSRNEFQIYNIKYSIDETGLVTDPIVYKIEEVDKKFATKEELNNLDIPEVDLSNYYTKSETDTLINQIPILKNKQFDILNDQWTQISEDEYKYILDHNQNIEQDSLGISCYTFENIVIYPRIEFKSNNSVVLTVSQPMSLKVIIKSTKGIAISGDYISLAEFNAYKQEVNNVISALVDRIDSLHNIGGGN